MPPPFVPNVKIRRDTADRRVVVERATGAVRVEVWGMWEHRTAIHALHGAFLAWTTTPRLQYDIPKTVPVTTWLLAGQWVLHAGHVCDAPCPYVHLWVPHVVHGRKGAACAWCKMQRPRNPLRFPACRGAAGLGGVRRDPTTSWGAAAALAETTAGCAPSAAACGAVVTWVPPTAAAACDATGATAPHGGVPRCAASSAACGVT